MSATPMRTRTKNAALIVVWIVVSVALVWLDWDETAGLVLRIGCCVLAWAFVWRFSRVNWQGSYEGRHMMGFTLIVAIFMTFATSVTLFGKYPGVDVVAVALYGWLAWLLWERHRLFSLAQKEREEATAND